MGNILAGPSLLDCGGDDLPDMIVLRDGAADASTEPGGRPLMAEKCAGRERDTAGLSVAAGQKATPGEWTDLSLCEGATCRLSR